MVLLLILTKNYNKNWLINKYSNFLNIISLHLKVKELVFWPIIYTSLYRGKMIVSQCAHKINAI